jgi:hypothetical protein
MTKWAGVDASAFSDSSSPRRVAKSSLRAAAKCCAGECSVCCIPRLIARLIPGKKIVSGAEFNRVSQRGVNHALHHADILPPS